MSVLVALIVRLFRHMLYLYPRSYRLAFGRELADVFDQAMQDARQRGAWSTVIQALRELRDLPGVLLRVHILRRKSEMAASLFPASPDRIPWRTALLSLVPFFLASTVLTFTSYHPWWDGQELPWINNLFVALTLLSLLIGFVLGIIHKFPRWSYPYSFFALVMLAFLLAFIFDNRPLVINQDGSILYLAIFLWLAVTALWPAFRPFYVNLAHDWTLLSYCLYAGTFFVVLFHDRDEVPSWNILVLLSSLLPLAGALAHLRLPSAAKRIAVLLVSMILGIYIWVLPVFDEVKDSAGISQIYSRFLGVSGVLAGLIIGPILIGVLKTLVKRTRQETII